MSLNEIRNAYQSTWLDWARHSHALQQAVEQSNPDSAQLERLLFAVEHARAVHNEVRDRLAAVLGHAPEPIENTPADERVRATAHLLWEFAGKPQGTAESDWQRAQTVVRTAAQG